MQSLGTFGVTDSPPYFTMMHPFIAPSSNGELRQTLLFRPHRTSAYIPLWQLLHTIVWEVNVIFNINDYLSDKGTIGKIPDSIALRPCYHEIPGKIAHQYSCDLHCVSMFSLCRSSTANYSASLTWSEIASTTYKFYRYSIDPEVMHIFMFCFHFMGDEC